jgi:hypothetical protein
VSLSSQNAEEKADKKDKKRKAKSLMGSLPSNDVSMVIKAGHGDDDTSGLSD